MKQVIIDVREPQEYFADHVVGSINIPPFELVSGTFQLKNIPKDAELIVYCNTGSRSAVALRLLNDMGFTNVINGINKYHVQAKYVRDKK